MRTIVKGKEPRELAEYRCASDAVYDGPLFTAVKNVIRERLLQEQGYLCAYCMKRIDAKQMKLEHWHCQHPPKNQPDDSEEQPDYSAEQLDYQNILGVCEGNQGQRWENQTCDTRKGNADLKYNPANPSHRIESQIRFLGNGKIQSDDTEFDRQLNDVLNLNYTRLEENRKAVWDAVHGTLSTKPGTRTITEIERCLGKWNTPDKEGRLQEYCAVAIYYLHKRQRGNP